MSLSLRKDPARRLGGWALIRLPAGATGGATGGATVTVRRADTGEWLGAADWQGGRHAFGPYRVETGANGPFLRVGPEIVNRMEAYLPFTLSLPELGLEADLDWPEDIPPAPEGAAGGGVGFAPEHPAELTRNAGAAATPAATPQPAPVQPAHAQPAPAEPPAPVEPPAAIEPPAPPPVAPPGPPAVGPHDPEPMRRSPLIPILLALLVAVGAGAAWWFLAGPATRPADPVVVEEEQQRPQESATEQAADEVAPEPALACVRDDVAATLQAEAPTVEDLRALIGLCRAAGDLDLEVRLLERLSSMGDAEALRRFATWYDPRDTVEARPFGEPDAANAASYYKRAIEAGSAEAADDLSALCTHLRGAGDTAARMVIAIHCE